MDLFPSELWARLPKLSTTERDPDPMVWVKYFDPFSQWTWYVLEAEDQGDDVLFYGYVVGLTSDLQYFRLSDLADMTSPEGERWHASVGMVRDLTFAPCPLSEVRRIHQEEASGV